METEVSLPCSQAVTWPCPETNYPENTLKYYLNSNLILSSHLRLGFLSGLLPSGFPLKPCMHFSSPPNVPHAQPNSPSGP